MTKKDFAIIAVRILALFMLLQAVGSLSFGVLPELFNRLRGWGTWSNPLLNPATLNFALLILTWAILWTKADSIAALVVRGCTPVSEPSSTPARSFDRQGAIIVGSALVGLYLLVRSITGVASEIGLLLYHSPRQDSQVYPQRYAVHLVAYLVQMAISLWLMLGSRGLVAFITRFQTAGIRSQQRPSQ